MASNPSRPPWETPRASPPVAAPTKSIGTLGVLAIAAGVGVLGYFMLDGHSHVCEACGHRWRHLGAFNLGDARAHTCKKCGTTQWWKDGFQHVFRDPRYATASEAAPGTIAQQQQEIREVPRPGVASGSYPPWTPR